MDAVNEVKARLSIEDVIGEYVQLKRTGRNWKGLSPFSSEKTPSFVVSPEKQIWHDFSSNKGGDIFTFIMEVEGLEFKEALGLLARKAGIDLEAMQAKGTTRRGPSKERLYALLELSTKFYQVQFSKHAAALNYVLKTRQFTKDTALAWRLGYAPNTGHALVDFAKKQGFSEEEIKQAGLSGSRFRGVSDMFRGRLMIPLQDQQGRVIGFTARLLDAADLQAPKYINTPQTALYDKSRHVYGLHLAKDAIRTHGYAVLVEGNLDVIASHQAGILHTVATAGTALTESHLKALSRFSNDVRLSFDADRAGIAATERAIPIASKVGVSLSMITLPDGKDPDELVRKDPELWRQAITQPSYALDWLMQRYQGELDITSAPGKRAYSDVLIPVIRALQDPVEQDHYLGVIAETIGVNKQALVEKLATNVQHQPVVRLKTVKPSSPVTEPVSLDNQKAQDRFLSLMLMRPSLREFLQLISPDMLYHDRARQLAAFLLSHQDFHGQLDQSKELQNLSDYVKIESVLYEELYQGLELNELHYEAARLQARLVDTFVKVKKAQLAQAMASASDVEIDALLAQAKNYDQLLKQVKGAVAYGDS